MNQFDIVTVFKQCRYARIKSKTLGYVVRRKKKEIFRSLFFSSPQSHVRRGEENEKWNRKNAVPLFIILYYFFLFVFAFIVSLAEVDTAAEA